MGENQVRKIFGEWKFARDTCKSLQDNLKLRKPKTPEIPIQIVEMIWMDCLDFGLAKLPKKSTRPDRNVPNKNNASETSFTLDAFNETFDFFDISEDQLKERLQNMPIVVRICEALKKNLNNSHPRIAKLPFQIIDRLWKNCVEFGIVQPPQELANNDTTYSNITEASNTTVESNTTGVGNTSTGISNTSETFGVVSDDKISGMFDIFNITKDQIKEQLKGMLAVVRLCNVLKDNLSSNHPRKPKLPAQIVNNFWSDCVDLEIVGLPSKLKNNSEKSNFSAFGSS